jgi:general secretion pathway protein C
MRAGLPVWLFGAAMAAGLGAAAAPVVWHLAGELPEGAAPAVAAPPPAAAGEAGVDLAPVLALAPFGRPAEAPAAAPEAAPEAVGVPATALGLTLLGVTLADRPDASRAIIAGGDLAVASYAPGAAVSAGAVLAEVRADHVILEVGGRREALAFADAMPGAGPGAGPGAPPAFAAAAPSDTDAVAARYRAEILRNPQAVLDRLGLEATPAGYRITAAAPPEVRQAGFRPGDLVTAVNGRPVGDVAADRARIDEIAAAGRASLEVARDGQTIRMTFPLR